MLPAQRGRLAWVRIGLGWGCNPRLSGRCLSAFAVARNWSCRKLEAQQEQQQQQQRGMRRASPGCEAGIPSARRLGRPWLGRTGWLSSRQRKTLRKSLFKRSRLCCSNFRPERKCEKRYLCNNSVLLLDRRFVLGAWPFSLPCQPGGASLGLPGKLLQRCFRETLREMVGKGRELKLAALGREIKSPSRMGGVKERKKGAAPAHDGIRGPLAQL